MRNFKLLALFCACAGWFVLDLFGNHIVGFPTRRLIFETTLQDDSDRKAVIHTRGCFKAVTSILHDNVIVVGGVIIGILVPQVCYIQYCERSSLHHS